MLPNWCTATTPPTELPADVSSHSSNLFSSLSNQSSPAEMMRKRRADFRAKTRVNRFYVTTQSHLGRFRIPYGLLVVCI